MYFKRFITGSIFLGIILITLLIDFIASNSYDKILPIIVLIGFVSLFFLNFKFYSATIFGAWKDLISFQELSVTKTKFKLVLADGQKIYGHIFTSDTHFDSTVKEKNADSSTTAILSKIQLEKNKKIYSTGKFVILHHGLTGDRWSLIQYIIPLTQLGYTTIIFDARGHGKSRKKGILHRYAEWYLSSTTGIFPDFKFILDEIAKFFNISSRSINLIGHSMGGAVVLSQGVTHPKVRRVIALDPFYSWKRVVNSKVKRKFFSESWIQYQILSLRSNFRKILKQDPFVAPEFTLSKKNAIQNYGKIRILYSKTDQVLLFKEQFIPLKSSLGLTENQYLVLNRGNHHLRGQETIVLAQILKWLKE